MAVSLGLRVRTLRADAGLTLSDVKAASEMTDAPSARATIKTFDGLVTEATGWKKDDKHYVALKTSYDAALAEKFKVATADAEKKDAAPSNAEGAPPTAKPATRNVEEESTKSNAQLTGWVYEVETGKARKIV